MLYAPVNNFLVQTVTQPIKHTISILTGQLGCEAPRWLGVRVYLSIHCNHRSFNIFCSMKNTGHLC